MKKIKFLILVIIRLIVFYLFFFLIATFLPTYLLPGGEVDLNLKDNCFPFKVINYSISSKQEMRYVIIAEGFGKNRMFILPYDYNEDLFFRSEDNFINKNDNLTGLSENYIFIGNSVNLTIKAFSFKGNLIKEIILKNKFEELSSNEGEFVVAWQKGKSVFSIIDKDLMIFEENLEKKVKNLVTHSNWIAYNFENDNIIHVYERNDNLVKKIISPETPLKLIGYSDSIVVITNNKIYIADIMSAKIKKFTRFRKNYYKDIMITPDFTCVFGLTNDKIKIIKAPLNVVNIFPFRKVDFKINNSKEKSFKGFSVMQNTKYYYKWKIFFLDENCNCIYKIFPIAEKYDKIK